MKDGMKLCCCAAVIAAIAGIAAYSWTESLLANEKRVCGKYAVVKGFPNKVKTVASLSAVRLWTEAAQKKSGPEYAMWHNASRKELKCIFVQNSEYIMCFAKGTPCKASKASGDNRG
ncbi:MAG: hypothetical protein ACR2OX_10605 [Methyloligellaceae bacterium]